MGTPTLQTPGFNLSQYGQSEVVMMTIAVAHCSRVNSLKEGSVKKKKVTLLLKPGALTPY